MASGLAWMSSRCAIWLRGVWHPLSLNVPPKQCGFCYSRLVLNLQDRSFFSVPSHLQQRDPSVGNVQPAVLPRTHSPRQIDGPGFPDDRRGANAVNRDQEREEVAGMERRGHAKTDRFTETRRRDLHSCSLLISLRGLTV